MKQVSIIITARNYGQFLAECIESCLMQTVDCEVIYSDDLSEDDSVGIAREYASVTVLAHDVHLGVAAARNAGAAIAKGKYLLFVDGDDVLPMDYVEQHLAVMADGVPFVYGALQHFGASDRLCVYPAWGERSLWQENFCNSSSLMSKRVFEAVGGWVEPEHHTLWDHHLFLRMQRYGAPRRSMARLLYRKHGTSNSDKRAVMRREALLALRRGLAWVTVGVVYGGRCSGLLNAWMDALVRDLNDVNKQAELIIINNSGSPMPDLSAWQGDFSSIRVVPGRNLQNSEDRRANGMAVAELLAESCQVIQDMAEGDIIHLREDDIIPEPGAFVKLWATLTEGVPLKAAVAGIYRNRHRDRVVGGAFNGGGVTSAEPKDEKPIRVDCTGTGCLLYWRDLAPRHFRASHNGVAAHDWAWGADLKAMGGDLWLLPDARCRHYIDDVDYVLPQVGEPVNAQNNHTRTNRQWMRPSWMRPTEA